MVVVLEAFDVRAAVALELRFDPVDGLAIAIRSLPPIAELRQPLDGGLVAFQIEPVDENFYWIGSSFQLGPAKPTRLRWASGDYGRDDDLSQKYKSRQSSA